jgi:hypothetical protein
LKIRKRKADRLKPVLPVAAHAVRCDNLALHVGKRESLRERRLFRGKSYGSARRLG